MTIAIDKTEAEILISCYEAVLDVTHRRLMGSYEGHGTPSTLPFWLEESFSTSLTLAQREWDDQCQSILARIRQLRLAFGIDPNAGLDPEFLKAFPVEYDATSGRPIGQVGENFPEPSPILKKVAPTAIERWRTSAKNGRRK